MTLAIADVLQIVTALGVVAGFYLTWRKLPSEMRATETAARQTKADADATDIDSLGKIYSMYKSLTVDIAEVLERERKNKLIQLDHETQIQTLTVELKTAKAEGAKAKAEAAEFRQQSQADRQTISDLTKRAEAAEKELADMRKWVPNRIENLEEEIKKLRADATLSLHTQAQQAENVKAALNTQAPDDNTVAVKITGELLDPKP